MVAIGFMTVMATLVLNIQKNTRLGQQYLKKLTQHYQKVKVQQPTHLDPILLAAIFGVDGLTNFDTCSPFREAFVCTAIAGTKCGGCGGGCGGCGG